MIYVRAQDYDRVRQQLEELLNRTVNRTDRVEFLTDRDPGDKDPNE